MWPAGRRIKKEKKKKEKARRNGPINPSIIYL